ncbi:dimethyl sulfoxide reductase anchor subunit family protein [Perlabentimonas gracilis]|uniref:dimethyl sulfoxide reductase anchor subunit family protein n=1 Tax=Perlabentimonas gracilis TaxID=2715279 RepID=UPI00140BD3D2|nr:DmsC/YnfH family molybdoenzyme membrane anchor subunit [Perlabentimonas gracilis]NHB68262.1 dimethyl sulfoxide reductase anchor subunit [Perlabentimonas gracilis]
MHSSEWSLLFFTLIGQFSAGLTTALLIYTIITPKRDDNAQASFLKVGLLVATGAIGIALIISFLHLSAPLSSVFALTNLKSSWLSREILMVSAYAASVFATTLYWLFCKGKRSFLIPLLAISSLLGLTMVLTMAKLYMIETIPVWNTPGTLIAFYVNTILLGSSFASVLFYNSHKDNLDKNVERVFVFVIITILAVKFISGLVGWDTTTNENIAFAGRMYHPIWNALSWAWLLGLGMLIRRVFPNPRDSDTGIRLYLLAFVFFVIAEFAARIIFYSSYFRIGL